MYRSFLSCAALASAILLHAQQQVHQVIVLSEGYYDYFNGGGQLVPVTLGSYDPETGTYETVATLTGPRFGSDVILDGTVVYVAADDRIVRFDADNYAETGMVLVQGVRKLAIWGDKLLITRGELGGLDHYFEVRDKTTFDLLWSINPADGLTMSAEDVVVVGDMAYLAVNNAFDWANLAGRVGVVDLLAQTYTSEIDLGANGLNPEKLFVVDGVLHTFNNKDFSGSSISSIELAGAALNYTNDVASNSGCAASAYADEKIYFMEYSQNELARYDIATASVIDTLSGSPAVYGLTEDPINGVLYATTTDFFSTGEFHVLGMDGQVQSTVPAAVSAGNMVLDIRLSTSLPGASTQRITLYPNPATEEVFFSIPSAGPVNVDLLDATGRLVRSVATLCTTTQRLAIGDLSPGCYTLRAAGFVPARFTKQ
ncbi:MAG: T9SS type A sorting domain-containing protein [Flavobacteriales bacterium]|nr:T9SS type A sorting domain-containing protein [Flavobacteriales bacterium]